MCGRYVLIDGKKVFATFVMLKDMKRAGDAFDELPRYNASPMQQMPVVAVRDGKLQAQKMQWWLIPHWSKDGKVNFSTFNAKAETLEQSKLFSSYFKGSRCLVPADAFYEWKKIPIVKEVRGTKRQVIDKIPVCICMKDDQPFMFAGLFSVWRSADGEEHPTYAIITTVPNKLIESIHDRMPVIVPKEHFEMWLDRDFKEAEKLKRLLAPYPARKMKAYPVSKFVSNSRNDSPECIKPANEYALLV